VPRVLLATDADWIHQEVDAALAGDDIEVLRVNQGTEVRPAVKAGGIDLVVLDLQIGNMGGMAACMDLRLDESVDLLPHVPVLMLLDRDVDTFLAKRSEADGWVVKPLDPFSLRRAATALLAGEEWKPEPSAGTEGPVELEGDDAEFKGTSEETRLADEPGDSDVDEVTASGDELADPTTEPEAEKSAESAADIQGP
jgi:DNA-binding response OmpR family regulator